MVPSCWASTLIPPNITARSSTITVSTRRAFFHSVGLNAITESLIASMPVRAAQPELKARISSTALMAVRPPCCSTMRRFCSAAAMGAMSPWASLSRPTPTTVSTAAINT